MARNFDTKFSRSQASSKFVSNSGTSIVKDYAYQVKDGVKKLVIVGEHDIQPEIDSYADSCDINVIVQRFLAGDETALNQAQGFYADMKSLPKTYAEWHERYQECENFFNRLPVDVREKFNHSVTEFWSDFGSDHFIDALSIKTVDEKKVSEVVENAE